MGKFQKIEFGGLMRLILFGVNLFGLMITVIYKVQLSGVSLELIRNGFKLNLVILKCKELNKS